MPLFNVYMDDVRPGPFYNGHGGFAPDVADWDEWITVRSINNVKEFLARGWVNKLSLDHDMGGEETGYDLVKWMVENNIWPKGQIWVHSANVVGAKNMAETIARYHPSNINPLLGQPE